MGTWLMPSAIPGIDDGYNFCFPPHAIRFFTIYTDKALQNQAGTLSIFLDDLRVSRTIVWGAYGFWLKVKPFFGFVIPWSFV